MAKYDLSKKANYK